MGKGGKPPYRQRKPDGIAKPQAEHEGKNALVPTADDARDQRTDIRAGRARRNHQNTSKGHKRHQVHECLPLNLPERVSHKWNRLWNKDVRECIQMRFWQKPHRLAIKAFCPAF